MAITDIPMFSMLRDRLSYLDDRQKVIAENVANADTPDYTARDLKPVDFTEALNEAEGMKRTSAKHLHGTGGPGGEREYEIEDAPDMVASLNGNSVALEDQLLKSNETQMQYQTNLNIYRKSLGMIRTAIGKGGAAV